MASSQVLPVKGFDQKALPHILPLSLFCHMVIWPTPAVLIKEAEPVKRITSLIY